MGSGALQTFFLPFFYALPFGFFIIININGINFFARLFTILFQCRKNIRKVEISFFENLLTNIIHF